VSTLLAGDGHREHGRLVAVAGLAYAIVAAVDVVYLHGGVHLASLAIAGATLAPIGLLVVLPYAVLAIFGESLRVPGAGKLSVLHVLMLVLLLRLAFTRDKRAVHAGTRQLLENRPLALLLAYVVLFALIGIARGNELTDVAETVLPFVYMGISYVTFGVLGRRGERWFAPFMLTITTLAAVKAVFLAFVPIDAAWDNAWQAARGEIPGSPVARVILRGADVLLVISFVIAAARLLFSAYSSRRDALLLSLVVLPLLVAANFVSMTRSNYVGIAAGLVLLAVYTRWPRRGVTSRRTALGLLTAFALAGLVFLALDQYFALIDAFLARTGADQGNASATLDWRAEETSSILVAIRNNYFLGSGAGTRFSFANDPNDRGQSIYSHNAYLWLLHHFGIVGLVLFLTVTGLLVYRATQQLRAPITRERRGLLAASAGAWISMAILSITVNKIGSISGGFVFGLLAAIIDRGSTSRASQPDAVVATRGTAE
jgi:hypothetical protein